MRRDKSISTYGKDLLGIKAELLCYGVRVDDPHPIMEMNPYFLEAGFIHGSHLILEDGACVNVAVNEGFVRDFSPFTIRAIGGNFVLFKREQPQCHCCPLPIPRWVEERVDAQTKAGDIVRPHSTEILFSAPAKHCVLDSLGSKCLFCTYEGPSYPVRAVRKAFERALSYNCMYEVAIGGATPSWFDCGATYYAQIVEEIKQMCEVPISVELIPPDDRFIDLLCDAGADALVMSLEVFNESVRKRVCPGKSQVGRERYFGAWKRALALLGEGNVSSVLLAGLEDPMETIAGSEEMIRLGVMPTVIPFRPYDSCSLRDMQPTSPEQFLLIARHVSELLTTYGLNPVRQPGCTRCGACSLERDLVNAVIA